MFKAWKKKEGRKKAQVAGLVPLGFMISSSARRKLRTHAKRLKIKEAEVLESLLLNTKDFAERRDQAEIKTLKKEIQELKAGQRVLNSGKRDTALFFESRELSAAIGEFKKMTAEIGEVLKATKFERVGGVEDEGQSNSAGGSGVQPHADKIKYDVEILADGDLVLSKPSLASDNQAKKKRKKKNKKLQPFSNPTELAESRNLGVDMNKVLGSASNRLLNSSLPLDDHLGRKEIIGSSPVEQAGGVPGNDVHVAKNELAKLANDNDGLLPEQISLMSADGTWKEICKFKEDRKKGHRVDNQALSQLIRHWADLRVSESPQTGRSYYLESAIDNFLRN